jgi:hypothetical protein
LVGSGTSNPIAPLPGTTYVFDYTVASGGAGNTSPLLFDPPAATGYDFQILGGPNFASVEVPAALPGTGQTEFTLTFGTNVETLTVGIPFFFTSVDPGGVPEFTITGIIDSGLSGDQPPTFDTAITFVDGGDGSFLQTPLFPNPEPGSLTLCALGAAMLLGWRRKMNCRVRP